MKLGILTYHRAINIGSIMQAFCLQKTLLDLFPGSAVEVIDYRPGKRDIQETFWYLQKRPPFIIRSRLNKLRQIRSFMNENLNLSSTYLRTYSEKKSTFGSINKVTMQFLLEVTLFGNIDLMAMPLWGQTFSTCQER